MGGNTNGQARGSITRTRLLKLGAAVLLVGVQLGVLSSLPASAALDKFNIDGVPDFTPASALDAVNSTSDSSYGGEGSSEDDICPSVGAGTIPPSKDDLEGVWIDIDGNNLYLGWSRTDTNGTASASFELNQSEDDCGNGINHDRTAGDLLVSFNFQGNDVDPDIQVGIRRWIGTATAGAWGPETLLNSSQAEGAISSDFSFGEIEIDLVASGIFSTTDCVNFASVFVKSRASSQGFSSKLKDVTPSVATTVTNCAYITIVKDATPDGATSFPFTFVGGGENESFSLVDDGNALTDGESWTSPGLLATTSTYLVNETVPNPTPGAWILTSATCDTAPAIWSFNATTGELSVTPGGPIEVTCTFFNAFDPPPTVDVTKTADVTSLNEPGGPVTYTVSVWNTSNEAVTVTSLTDLVGTNVANLLATSATSDCDTADRELAASNGSRGGDDTMTCTFTISFTGNALDVHNNRVDAIVTDAQGDTGTDFDTESVGLVDVLPTVDVTKSADPVSIAEPGGSVTFSVVVTNTSAESVTLTSLVDDIFGNLNGKGNCATGGTIAAGASYSCSFTANVTGQPAAPHRDVVTGVVTDDDGATATDNDDAVVTFVDVLPSINVEKSPSAPVVRSGTTVTYTYVVTNTGIEALSNVALTDDKCSAISFTGGDTDGDNALDVSEAWTFSCAQALTASTTNVATATGKDDDGNTATDTDDASVRVIDPVIAIDKSSNVESTEVGGSVSYTYAVTNPGNDPLSDVTVTDDKCSPVTATGGDADGDNKLDPGETWTYVCNLASVGAGLLTNVAVATGAPTVGPSVSASDTVTITVVLGAVIELPRTGAEALRLVQIAVVLIGLGLGLLGMNRRRAMAKP